MSLLGLLLRCNIRWILVFIAIFIYASGILANASSLSQWYSKKTTDEILGFANNDFVVSQTGMLEMVNEVHGRLAALKDVKYVVSMVCLRMSFSYIFTTPTGSYGILGVRISGANGTEKYIGFEMLFTGFLGLDGLMSEAELGEIAPQQGTVILSKAIAKEVDIAPRGNFTTITPLGNMTFQVSGITDFDQVAIWKKIDGPESPLVSVELPRIGRPPELFPSPQPLHGEVFVSNSIVIVPWEEVVDLCNMFWDTNLPGYTEVEILHYVFTERENIVDPSNLDVSVANLKQVKQRIEFLVSDVPTQIDSVPLQSLEAVAPGVNLFSAVTGGYMLAALPLYWFIASALVNIFAHRKGREIALFRIKGMSTRKIALTYTYIVLISAVVGCGLSALIQANVLNVLIKGYTGLAYEGTGVIVFGIVLPDITSFLILLALGLVLAFLAVWNIIRSITSLQPVEAVGRSHEGEERAKRLGKLPIVLLVLGLLKIGLVLGGLNPSAYFQYSFPNPYVSMAVGVFAAFDLYALTALAPVFVAYGFAKTISTYSQKFQGLIKALSYLAGRGRRKISFRLISSEMWRASAILLLLALLISYGMGSYVSNGSLTEHIWKMAGEFTGSDIRIDCLPNATQTIEQILETHNEVLDYARIDLVTVFLIYHKVGVNSFFHVSLMIANPEQYNRLAYLDNAPDSQSVLENLTSGQMVGLKEGLSLKDIGVGQEGAWYIPYANATFDTNLYSNVSSWQEINITKWTDITLPGTIENPETIKMAYPLRTFANLGGVPDEPVYPEIIISRLYLGRFRYGYPNALDLPETMATYTQEGPLWDVGEFISINETIADVMHLHYKTHFIVKSKGQTDISSLASTLRSQLPEGVIVITREEATNIITKSAPKITTGLAFTQINSLLITAIALGGLAAVTITTASGRTRIFSLLRIRGAKKIDTVSLFIPEVIFVSLVAGIIGTALGLTLAVGFTSALTDFIPPLFTGGTFQMSIGLITWLFLSLILIAFALMYITATFSQSKINKGAG